MPTTNAPIPFYQQIINAACKYYNCTQQQLSTSEYIEQRKITAYLLRHEAMLKYKHIQKIFNQKNHSFIYRQIIDVDAQKNVSRSMRMDIENIKILSGICA